jgi:hypothetical protein
MSHVRYFVMRHAGHWVVTLEGRTMAQVATEQEAVSSAIVMADLMGSMHHDADVMLDDGERLDLIWTYGRDAARDAQHRKVPLPSHPESRSHVKHAQVAA